jgi:uncharacterized protein (DUF1330 family)
MKRYIAPALTLATGIAIGAVAAQNLHAQAKLPVYYISEIDVTNPEAYAKEYSPKAQALIKAGGGKIVAVGGAAQPNTQVVAFDGDPPKRVTVQVWDSMDQIKAWRANPDYQAARKIGEQYAMFRSFALQAVAQ